MLEVVNFTRQRIEKKFFEKIVKNVLKSEKKEKQKVSVFLVGEKRIKDLNKKYKKKNKSTDVLSFGEVSNFIEPEKKRLGEIVICLEKVKKNARKYKNPFKKELARVLIHGILHLLGYNHEKSTKEEKKMRSKEEYYLSKLFKS